MTMLMDQVLGFNSEDLVYSELAKGQLTVRDIIEKFQPTVTDDQIEDVKLIIEF